MADRDPLRPAAQRAAAPLMLLALLSTASCMTQRPAPRSTAVHAMSTIDPPIDPVDPRNQCEEFACER